MTTSTHPADTSTDGARIDTTRDAMQQALEALELGRAYAEGERLENERRYRGYEHLAPDDAYALEQIDAAIAALRAALAEQARGPGWCPIHQHYKPCEHNTAKQAQPVAWMVKDEGLYWTEEAAIRRAEQLAEPLDVVPLYTTPPAPQSLRDLCAAAYQVVGVADGPVEMLDNLWAAAEGKPLPHDPGAGLPWSQPSPQPLTERELELLDGMIEVQLQHAAQCDLMLARAGGNHIMAERQKGWDMERVELLRKIRSMGVQR